MSILLTIVSHTGLKNSNRKLAEASIRSLRTFYISPQTPVDPIYEVSIHSFISLRLRGADNITIDCFYRILQTSTA